MTVENQTKTAVVTGGSRGIGRACVVALAEAGYNIAFSYAANKAAAQEVEQTVGVLGRQVLAIQADAANPLEAQMLIDQAQQTFGRLDVLVNNAGITKDTLLLRMNDDDWSRVIDTNLTGVFYTTRAAAKYMMKQRSGNIVNISSVVGVHGNAGQANYAASKAGIIGLTKSVAKELGSRNINVNAIAPGFINTEMTEKVDMEKLLSHIPLGRPGTADDIAKTVLFLVTSGSYITGQVIQVDGGLIL
jgi:3-oxoacyl-[acyl-carrier protein] reductase